MERERDIEMIFRGLPHSRLLFGFRPILSTLSITIKEIFCLLTWWKITDSCIVLRCTWLLIMRFKKIQTSKKNTWSAYVTFQVWRCRGTNMVKIENYIGNESVWHNINPTNRDEPQTHAIRKESKITFRHFVKHLVHAHNIPLSSRIWVPAP